MQPIFKNLNVLELGSVLAAPSVGLFFAELGAKVTKIENSLVGGDVTRTWKSSKEDSNAPISAYYAAVNWNKEVLFLDLTTKEAQQTIHTLIQQTDIVITNYKPSSAAKLEMDYATLSALNPSLIYANITGFGEDEDRAAFDVVLQAESGFMFMNGQTDSPPTKMPVALIDVLAAHQLKEGILVALYQRYHSQKGQYIAVSLLESALASLVNQATNYLMVGMIPQRLGSLHPNIAPYGEIFITQDNKQLVLAIGNDKQFSHLCKGLQLSDLIQSDLFKTNNLRVQHRTDLTKQLEQAFKQVTASFILEYCHEHYVPIGQIRDMQQVFELEKAQNMILEQTEADGSISKRVQSIAFRFL